jgi:hypothetical protein
MSEAGRSSYVESIAGDAGISTHDQGVLSSDGFAGMSEAGKQSYLESIGIKHEGGIVGYSDTIDNSKYSISQSSAQLLHNILNVKPNERVIKALRGEVVANPNIAIDNLIGNIRGIIPTIAVPQEVGVSKDINISGNLLNVEKATFEDETDMEILARELSRQISVLRN